MTTSLFLVQTLNGLQLGALLFLIAAGLTLVIGVMNFINLAHGVQYMLGAYLTVTFYVLTGSFLYAFLLALPAVLLLGLLFEILVFRRLYERDHLDQLLATFGVTLFVNEGVGIVQKAAPLHMPIPETFSGSVRLMEEQLYSVWGLVLISTGLLVALALWLFVHRTRIGMRIRAGMTNAAMISALGFNVRRLFTMVFGIGAMLAGFAGIMVAPIHSVAPGMSDTILILAFVVIVIGGIGSIHGALFAALIVGLLDSLGGFFAIDLFHHVVSASAARQAGPAFVSMLIYLLAALIIFFRPAGLFPAKGR